MRILVVDCNVRYMNPMRNLTPYYLSKVGDVTFYGPGYTPYLKLEKGLACFVETYGPFDAIIYTVHAISMDIIDDISSTFAKSRLQFYRQSFSYSFQEKDLILFWKDTYEINSLANYNVALLHQFDFQVMSPKFSDYLLRNFDLIVGLNKDFWERRDYSKLDVSSKYKHTNCWYDFIDNNPEKIVGLMNFVTGTEFCNSPLENREHTWSVVGTSYISRKVAKETLSKSSIDIDDGRSFMYKLFVILSKLGFSPYSKRKNLDLMNSVFHQSLINSKYSFTCGSDLKMPIRKYFEIPAAGAVLACVPCKGFEKLGFVDNENAIACQPSELPELTAYLDANLDYAQQIASSGQELILNKHIVEVRAKQLKQTIELGLVGQYVGSHWNEGDLIWHGINDGGSRVS